MVKKALVFCAMVVVLLSFTVPPALAQDKATTKDVYDLIIKAAEVVQSLGEDGLEAFKDPKGEFTYKDTYVLVIDCATMKMAAHPNPKLVGMDLSAHKDQNPDPAKQILVDVESCKLGENPNGGWIEYWWPKLGEDKPSRKVSFVLKVPGTSYLLVSGIYSDDADVAKLNAELN